MDTNNHKTPEHLFRLAPSAVTFRGFPSFSVFVILLLFSLLSYTMIGKKR